MILFENLGTLDMRAVKVMGVSAKDEGRSVFGYFGTGLKYAIAVLLRNGHKVWIHDGLGTQYEFGVVSTQIRNKNFDIVTMNGEELGFTTALGKNWETWMAFRELHCNAADEGGFSKKISSNRTFNAKTDLGLVRVLVVGDEIEHVFSQKDEYILNSERDWEYNELNVKLFKRQPGLDNRGNIFYKGVRVGITPEPSVFDYNFTSVLDLTEDRTLKYWHLLSRDLGNALFASDNEDFIAALMMTPDCSFESKISLNYSYSKVGSVFLDTIGALRKKFKDIGINDEAIRLHKKYRQKSIMPTKSCKMSDIQTKQLCRAKIFCEEQLGLRIDEFPLIICEDLGKGGLGRADMEANIMYLSLSIFGKGTKYVVMGLIEEYTHLKHRVHDETFEQKQVYLEMIASLGEQLQGEPL